MEQKEIFANNVSDKELQSRIHRQLLRFNKDRNKNNLIKNEQRTWKNISPKKINGQEAYEKMDNISSH